MHKRKVTKGVTRKLHLKVTNTKSTIDHIFDYKGVGVVRDLGHIPRKWTTPPPPHPAGGERSPWAPTLVFQGSSSPYEVY